MILAATSDIGDEHRHQGDQIGRIFAQRTIRKCFFVINARYVNVYYFNFSGRSKELFFRAKILRNLVKMGHCFCLLARRNSQLQGCQMFLGKTYQN
jgi:hypothetical protein